MRNKPGCFHDSEYADLGKKLVLSAWGFSQVLAVSEWHKRPVSFGSLAYMQFIHTYITIYRQIRTRNIINGSFYSIFNYITTICNRFNYV